MILLIILISILDVSMLILFVLHERQEREDRERFLKEYKEIQERYCSLVLSPDVQKRVDELDAYFESIRKSLFDIDKHIVEDDSKS